MGTAVHIPAGTFLGDIVLSFWQVHRENTYFQQETIIPKGTVEIIFNLSGESEVHGQLYNGDFIMPMCFIQGYQRQPIQINLPPNQLFFGIVLHAAAVKHLFTIPAGEFADFCIDMRLVDPGFYALGYRLMEEKEFMNRVNVIAGWIKTRLPYLTAPEKAFNYLLDHATHKTVTELATWAGCSTRQLSRKFYSLTGMNSEQTILYKKYLQALHLIHTADVSLTGISYACDFTDQSHFIKTFKTFTRLTPKEYRNNKSDIPGHIFSVVR